MNLKLTIESSQECRREFGKHHCRFHTELAPNTGTKQRLFKDTADFALTTRVTAQTEAAVPGEFYWVTGASRTSGLCKFKKNVLDGLDG